MNLQAQRGLLAFILLAASLLVAQEPGRCLDRTILANVLDQRTDVVRNLPKTSFRLRVGGRRTEILEADYQAAPHRIVLLLDTSGSMRGPISNKKWTIARTAAEEFVKMTPSEIPIALLTFDHKVDRKFGFALDRSVMMDWLKQTSGRPSNVPRGATSLWDAILAASEELRPSQPGDVIFAITDAVNNAGRASRTDAEKALLQAGVRFLVFLLEERTWASDEAGHTITALSSEKDDAVALSKNTGGFVFSILARPYTVSEPLFDNFEFNESIHNSIRAHMQAANVLMSESYVLRFTLPRENSKLEDLSLEIVDEKGKRRKDLTVALPHQLSSCERNQLGRQ